MKNWVKKLVTGLIVFNTITPILYAQPVMDGEEVSCSQIQPVNEYAELKRTRLASSYIEVGKRRKEREIVARMLLHRIKTKVIARCIKVSVERIEEIKKEIYEIVDNFNETGLRYGLELDIAQIHERKIETTTRVQHSIQNITEATKDLKL